MRRALPGAEYPSCGTLRSVRWERGTEEKMNWSQIYATIGPAGVVLVLVACAGVYLALKSYVFLFLVCRDFGRTFPELVM